MGTGRACGLMELLVELTVAQSCLCRALLRPGCVMARLQERFS